MFKLGQLPSPRAKPHELADWIELQCLRFGIISIRGAANALKQRSDNLADEGCSDEDDEAIACLDEALGEVARRRDILPTEFPFIIESEGQVVRRFDQKSLGSLLYRFLLLTTRLNMTAAKVQGGQDGTQLFEELTAIALSRYLRAPAVQTMVFGTASLGGFEEKARELCARLEEGEFRPIDNAPVDANDDGLDVVTWIPFPDGLAGKLLIFCQCKTGTSWSEATEDLQPDHFIQKWIPGVVSKPVRAFSIAESPDIRHSQSRAIETGLILDRCRLVSVCDQLPEELSTRIEVWTSAAQATIH